MGTRVLDLDIEVTENTDYGDKRLLGDALHLLQISHRQGNEEV